MNLHSIRMRLLRWLHATDNAEHSRILNKYWRESEERWAIRRELDMVYIRHQTDINEKDRQLADCRNSLRHAALQLSARNVAPIEAADRAMDALLAGNIPGAIKELQTLTAKQEAK